MNHEYLTKRGYVVHDIRTPLSVLSSNPELMKEDELPADGLRHLSVAYRKHIDLVRLVKNLTDAAGMEKGKIVCAWRPVSELLAKVNDRHAADCGGAGITLNVRFAENHLVWADESRVRSVFDNLIGNALRYAPEGGSISVTAENMAGGFVLIRVLDTGPGIPPEHLPRIFDPYYKADPSRGAQGSGMGLHIVKTAAEGMGGSVLAGNAPGGGFCVSVTLPAREP